MITNDINKVCLVLRLGVLVVGFSFFCFLDVGYGCLLVNFVFVLCVWFCFLFWVWVSGFWFVVLDI